MNPDQVKAAIEALKGGDGAAALEVLEALLVQLATGGAGEPDGDEGAGAPPAASGAGAVAGSADESKDPSKNPGAEPGASAGKPPAKEPPAKPEPAMNALARGVIELFGGDAGSALRAVRAMHTEHMQRKADAAALEGVERRGLVADLVRLEVEVPATAWVDPEKTGADLVPVPRLATEDIVSLRKRVSLIKSTRGTRTRADGRPPAQEQHAPAKRALTRAEQAYCKRHGISAEEFEARKASAARPGQ